MMHSSSESSQPISSMYRTVWRTIAPLLKVPQQPPSLPGNADADDAQVEVFPPDPAFLRYLYFGSGVILAIITLSLLVVCIAAAVSELLIGLLLIPLSIVFVLAIATIFFVAVRVRYDTTWYAITDRAMRIRRGIWTIRETTVSFENVQNVSVKQGPLERYFDIASVTIETAGSGSTGNSVTNQAKIEGIRDAQQIRDLILKRLRETKTTGLGDDEVSESLLGGFARNATHNSPSQSKPLLTSPTHLAMLREIRDLLAAVE